MWLALSGVSDRRVVGAGGFWGVLTVPHLKGEMWSASGGRLRALKPSHEICTLRRGILLRRLHAAMGSDAGGVRADAECLRRYTLAYGRFLDQSLSLLCEVLA